MLPKNLPALLRAAGLTVVEIPGWQKRGRPGAFNPVGVLNHHTGASAQGWSRAKRLSYAEWMFLTGRSDLHAPLCQIALGPDGTVYIGAAGRANHAGKAKASGSVSAGDGNTLYIGIEWMLSGTEKIPAIMRRAGVVLNAVLTETVTKTSVETISAHYQTSVTGKWDIGDPDGIDYKGHKVLDVDAFRNDVARERHRMFSKPTPNKKDLFFGRVWNMKVGRGLTKKGRRKVAHEVRSLLLDNPLFFGALETAGNVSAIGDALDGRYVRVGGGKGERGSTRLYVRKDAKILASGVLTTKTLWFGPKGGPHRGRSFPWATIRNGGKTVTVVIVHKEWNRKRNRKAWNASNAMLIEFFAEHEVVLAPGDYNISAHTGGVGTMKNLAKRVGGQIHRTSAPLDYAITKGIAEMAHHVGARKGSDHPPITYRVDKIGSV